MTEGKLRQGAPRERVRHQVWERKAGEGSCRKGVGASPSGDRGLKYSEQTKASPSSIGTVRDGRRDP